MKEYCIYQQIGDGCPFILQNYSTFNQAKQSLLNIISDFDYKRKIYYIDNDFYENKYILGLPKQFYFQIQVREVSDWINADDFNKNNITKEKNKCKIINFHI